MDHYQGLGFFFLWGQELLGPGYTHGPFMGLGHNHVVRSVLFVERGLNTNGTV